MHSERLGTARDNGLKKALAAREFAGNLAFPNRRTTMEFVGEYMKVSDRFAFAGPKEELDKLAAINWSAISFKDVSDNISELHTPVRYSDNSISFEVDILQPLDELIVGTAG